MGAPAPGCWAGREALPQRDGWGPAPCLTQSSPLERRPKVGERGVQPSICPQRPPELPWLDADPGHLLWGPRSPAHVLLARCPAHVHSQQPPPGTAARPTPHREQPGPCLGMGWLPVPQVSAHNLSQAVAPEEAAEHDAGLLLVPAKVLAHGGGADGHAGTRAVQQTCAQQQRPRPRLALGPAGRGVGQAWEGVASSICLGRRQLSLLSKV